MEMGETGRRQTGGRRAPEDRYLERPSFCAAQQEVRKCRRAWRGEWGNGYGMVDSWRGGGWWSKPPPAGLRAEWLRTINPRVSAMVSTRDLPRGLCNCGSVGRSSRLITSASARSTSVRVQQRGRALVVIHNADRVLPQALASSEVCTLGVLQ